MNPRRSMRLDDGLKNQEVENHIWLVPFYLGQIMKCQSMALQFGRLWIEFWLPMARIHSSMWVIWFWPSHSLRIMLKTKLVNLDVIRKYVVARERLREIVCRNPSRAWNPFCKLPILTPWHLSLAYKLIYMKIFAIASPHADLPTELINKVSDSGFAMISKWCPQQTVLSHPVSKAILYSFNYTWSSFLIGYRVVFKPLWTQQYPRSFIARYTNVGNLPRWIVGIICWKNLPQNRLATFFWPTWKRNLYFAFPWRRAWIDSSSDRGRRIETPAPRRESTRWYLRISSSGGKRRVSKNQREWGRTNETKCWSSQR